MVRVHAQRDYAVWSTSTATTATTHDTNTAGMSDDRRPPDGGWGWMIVLAAFFLNLLNGGIFSIHGILYEEFLLTFPDLTKTSAAWLTSAQAGLCFISGLITGTLLARWTSRTVTVVGALMISVGLIIASFSPNSTVLCLSFTILAGMGMGLQCLPSSVMVQMYFHRKRSLAAAIGLCGGSSGVFIYPPLCRLLMEAYGWRGMLLVMGGLLLNSVPLGLLLRPLGARERKAEGQGKQSTGEMKHEGPDGTKAKCSLRKIASCMNATFDVKVLRQPSCCMILTCWFLTFFGYNAFYTFITVKGTKIMLTKNQTVTLISVSGIFETVGRLGSGILGNIRHVNRIYLFGAGIFFCGVSSIFGGAVSSFSLLMVYAVVFGTSIGVFVGQGPTVCVDLLGKDVLPRVLGFSFLTGGLGTLVSVPSLAYAWEMTDNISVPFFIAGSAQILAAIILLIFYISIGRSRLEPVEKVEHDLALETNIFEKEEVFVNRTHI